MASQDWFDKDFYAVLGVGAGADAAAIKKAYRKLARKLHPDHNAGAEGKFKEIGEAYAVLSDPEQRQQYDQIRTMAHGGARFTSGGAGGGGGGGFEDVFSGMFGDGGAGGGPRMRYSTSGGGAQPDHDPVGRSLVDLVHHYDRLAGQTLGNEAITFADASVGIHHRHTPAGPMAGTRTSAPRAGRGRGPTCRPARACPCVMRSPARR